MFAEIEQMANKFLSQFDGWDLENIFSLDSLYERRVDLIFSKGDMAQTQLISIYNVCSQSGANCLKEDGKWRNIKLRATIRKDREFISYKIGYIEINLLDIYEETSGDFKITCDESEFKSNFHLDDKSTL
jgi:hypothetical protein